MSACLQTVVFHHNNTSTVSIAEVAGADIEMFQTSLKKIWKDIYGYGTRCLLVFESF